ncbi:protein ACTIVITY OF BC1 COMPLEX KINASE 3, chloroplastic-like isoform X2 [Pyrus communis]|uniref:protein ACTIVITY OF BC1 COMPLEX KINASE 3, chloroplastic-like isoform X2 n=1 Tax=Pyrus communis TaxID=23211 RepID=UPI0035BEC8FF
MARDYYALNFLSPDVDVSPIVPALCNFFDDVLNSTVSELNFKTFVDGLGAVLYQYPFNVPAYCALILRSLTVLEGLALNADPNFKVELT